MALLWSVAEKYANLLVSLAGSMVLARLLTPTQVGVFSLCASVLAVAGILRDFGVSEYLIQEKELTDDRLRAAFAVAIAIAWSMAALIFMLREPLAAFYGEPGVASVLSVLCLNFLLLPLASPAFALLTREMAFRKMFVVQMISNSVHTATSIVLAWRGHGYMSLAWGPVAGIATQVLLVTLARPRESLLLPSFREARQVLRYGTLFVASRTIEIFTRNAHEFMIGKQLGFAAVGLFSRAFGLIEMFNTAVLAAIQRVASPVFANQHRAGHALAESFARGTAIFTCIALPFLGFIALMAGDIILVLFGHQWDAAAPLARILAISLAPTYLVALAPNLLASTGHVQRRLKVTMWYSPVHLCGVLLASFFGLEAIAAVWGVSNIVMVCLYSRQLRIVLGTGAATLFKPSLGSLLVTALSVLAQAATLLLCCQLDMPALVNLIAVTLAGAAGWLLAVRYTAHPVHEEIMRAYGQLRLKARP